MSEVEAFPLVDALPKPVGEVMAVHPRPLYRVTHLSCLSALPHQGLKVGQVNCVVICKVPEYIRGLNQSVLVVVEFKKCFPDRHPQSRKSRFDGGVQADQPRGHLTLNRMPALRVCFLLPLSAPWASSDNVSVPGPYNLRKEMSFESLEVNSWLRLTWLWTFKHFVSEQPFFDLVRSVEGRHPLDVSVAHESTQSDATSSVVIECPEGSPDISVDCHESLAYFHLHSNLKMLPAKASLVGLSLTRSSGFR